jgi:hypothetical protein
MNFSREGLIVTVRSDPQTTEHELLMDGADLLYDCGHQFRKYERLHRAKQTDEGNQKADANAVWAEKCENFCKRVNQWTSQKLKQ